MTFDYTTDGEVTVDMSDYVKVIPAEMPEDMKGKAPTPAASHLIQVRDDSVPVDVTYNLNSNEVSK
jgi:hypothetical protein